MGFFKSTGRFFSEIIKDIIKLVIKSVVVIFLIFLAIRYLFGFNPLSMFF